MSEPFAIRRARLEDIAYVMALQRANRESVGGLPQPAIEDRLLRGTLALGTINGDPSGYLMYDYRDGLLRIPQACIQYDARRRTYGEALFAWVLAQYPTIAEARIRCAADLEANLFWQSMGFDCVSVVQGGSRRGRLINVWRRWFDVSSLFGIDAIAVTPSAQSRVDCRDEQTDFLTVAPTGFVDAGELPKLAWANRKGRSS